MSDEIGMIELVEWYKMVCILCECNCGIEVWLGVDGCSFDRICGDKSYLVLKGYMCEKVLCFDYYQNGRVERLFSLMCRRVDGIYEAIDWDIVVREIAECFGVVWVIYGGEVIVYYGGGGQGNYFGGIYGLVTRGVFDVCFKTTPINTT